MLPAMLPIVTVCAVVLIFVAAVVVVDAQRREQSASIELAHKRELIRSKSLSEELVT